MAVRDIPKDLTVAEVAKLQRRSKQSVHQAIKRGTYPGAGCVVGKVLIPLESVRAQYPKDYPFDQRLREVLG